MSTEPEENLIQIDSVDVDINYKENASANELISDSGVDTTESYSGPYPETSDSDASPTKSSEDQDKSCHIEGIENESDSLLSSPISVSPVRNELSDRIITSKENSLNEKSNIGVQLNNTCSEDIKSVEQNDFKQTDIKLSSGTDIEPQESRRSLQCENEDFKNVTCRDFMSSTISLNEQSLHSTNEKTALSKSPYSRSAENICMVENNISKAETTSNNEINSEQILSEFSSHKSKVSAIQKIPEQTQPNVDLRYARIPKELIPQDLGSIVKNVHGIFSSVSGSLKNVYNNTHRISAQKAPFKPLTKPIPNGKVMSYIFEDESIEEKQEQNDNGINELKHNDTDISNNLNSPEKSEPESIELDSDSKKDVMKFQVETLEKLLAEQRKENASLREQVKQHIDELQEKDHNFKDLENKLDVMSKHVKQAEKEKDAAVMRYCSVECTAIEAKRASEKAAAAEKAALQEAQLLANKLKSAHTEKQRICQLYDDKCHDLMSCERELSKTREEMRDMEGRLKWTQSKLRMEMDAYKESADRADNLALQVRELEAAKDVATTNSADSARAKQLETELKGSQVALILCGHERGELERRVAAVSRQLETCERERAAATSALALATAEVEQLKASNLRLEEEAAELAAMRAQAALADTLSAQLERETERCSRAEAALAEARALAETCAQREAAALEHAARLTAQHVHTRAAAHTHHDKVQALSADNAGLRERAAALEAECGALKAALATEVERRNKENKVLARKVAELTEEVADTSKKLEWEKGENGVLKKKHASAIKELNRELQRALKRCEQLEAKLQPPDAASTRTGSVTSLSSGEGGAPDDRLQNGHADAAALPDIQVREPDRQALIERIVSLQRAAARRAERYEFLEEHSRQLTGELRAKSKLLRHLLSSMPAGAVASHDRDANKKEIARLGGGAMAAVWGGDPSGITLELSLEMNKRLQAVLEDALLKNITLKENMDTLGAEISRLKENKKGGNSGN